MASWDQIQQGKSSISDLQHELQSDPIRIPCKVCGDSCIKSTLEAGTPWIHEDDAYYISRDEWEYDHRAQPDIIDVKESQ